MKKISFVAIVAFLIISILSSSFTVFTLWPREQAKVYADTPIPHTTKYTLALLSFTPKTLSIPRLKIKLQIDEGFYDAQTETWSLNDHDAFINADQPSASTEEGAPLVFIYGHNTSEVLGRTIALQPEDELVLTDGTHTIVYRFTQAFLVKPTETSVVDDTSDGNLALLSCDGLLSQDRRVMYFDLARTE